jgi:hypothetical protein
VQLVAAAVVRAPVARRQVLAIVPVRVSLSAALRLRMVPLVAALPRGVPLVAAPALQVAPLLAAMVLALCVPVPLAAARLRAQAALRVQLLAVLPGAVERQQTLCSARCKRNMSRY